MNIDLSDIGRALMVVGVVASLAYYTVGVEKINQMDRSEIRQQSCPQQDISQESS